MYTCICAHTLPSLCAIEPAFARVRLLKLHTHLAPVLASA